MEYVTLRNGVRMPMLGYGVYQVSQEDCERCVLDALAVGYRALEDLYEAGKVRAIGISNFYPDRMVDIASFARIRPMVNQVEVHPLHQQTEAKEWLDKYGIQMEAWAPFGEGRGGLFENPVLARIGAKYGKTPAQVMLRWHLQRGVVVIPKSTHIERMRENLDVFDFTLTTEDMAAIAALDQKQSAFFSHQDPAMVEWFVKMVEERKHQHNASQEKKSWCVPGFFLPFHRRNRYLTFGW